MGRFVEPAGHGVVAPHMSEATAPMPSVARLARIHGRVQGVGYRYWASLCAANLGLKGYVRNLTDGSVEALFVGPVDDVARMIALCEEGPDDAQVARIETGPPRLGQRLDLSGFRRLKTVDPVYED